MGHLDLRQRELGGCLALAIVCGLPGQAAAQVCDTRYGGAVVVCGTNGGTASQVFSPGSVIVLRQGVPGLPDGVLPDDAEALRKGWAFTRLERGNVSISAGAFGGTREQAGTDRERAHSSDLEGVAMALRLEQPGGAWFITLDHSREEQDYEGGVFGDSRGGDPGQIHDGNQPLPPASLVREDTGLGFGGSLELREGLVLHGSGRFGRIDLETQRTAYDLNSVDFPTPDPSDNIKTIYVGRGSTEGRSLTLEAGLSHGQALGAGVFGGISGALVYNREEFDGYAEADAVIGTTYVFGEDERTSVVSRIGVELARPARLGGAQVVPSLRAAWLHEFADDSRAIPVTASALLTGSLNIETDFTIRTNDPDRDYFTLGASLGTSLGGDGAQLTVSYDAVLGHDLIDEQIVSLQLTARF